MCTVVGLGSQSEKLGFHMLGSPRDMSFEAWCMMHESFVVRDRYGEDLSSDGGCGWRMGDNMQRVTNELVRARVMWMKGVEMQKRL